MKKHHQGVTLLEALLVLAVIASVTTVGLRMYDSYKHDLNVNQISADIDKLFYAASQYYRSQCAFGGALDPLANHSLGFVVPLDIKTTLIDGGFLGSSFPLKNNPYINYSGGYNGYAVQLNRYDKIRYDYFCSNPPSCTVMMQKQIGTIISWTVQVSVDMKITSGSNLTVMQSLLRADCLTSVSGNPAKAVLCATNPSGNYITIERIPRASSMTNDSGSPFWQSMAVSDQVTLELTTPDEETLATGDHSTEYQYFYCTS